MNAPALAKIAIPLPAAETRKLLADGGTHLFEGGLPTPVPLRDPIKPPRSYARHRPYKQTGVYAQLRAMKPGGEPITVTKKQQSHAGSFAVRFGGSFKTKTMACGKLVKIWRIT